VETDTKLFKTIIATAIPKITDEFHGLNKILWYGSAFFLTNGGFQSSWGKAYKYFHLKITFLLSILVFEVGSLVCGVAPNSTTLIIGRAIQGLGAAGIGTGAYTIIAFVAEPRKRPTFTGIIGVSYGIASALGPPIGGAFADKISWRWCFYINLPIGGVSALIILLFFHNPRDAKPVEASWKEKLLQMDPVGVAMIMGAILMYILALQYGGQTKAWDSSDVIGLIVGFVVILIVFGIWEYFQGERAIIVPRLFKQRTVGISSIYAFVFLGSYFLVIYYLPIYFQSVNNVSATMSGVDSLPLILAVTVAMISSGMFITATGIASPIKVSGAAIAIVASVLLYTLDTDTSTGKWVGYQILGGVGWGIAWQVPIMVGQGNADPKDISSITAIILGES
jgi:MFS transporter, DHA2 family, glioxin efflux transporter